MYEASCKKWLHEKLIPNLEPKSVIVVNCVSYHNVQINWHTTSIARKGEMLFWLDKHGIWYSSSITKVELYDKKKCINHNMRLFLYFVDHAS
jgi:hypothetical protein